MQAVDRHKKSLSLQTRKSKNETKALFHKTMGDYKDKMFVDKADNITVSETLDVWIVEDRKPSSLSNETVMAYTAAVKRIKQPPTIGNRKLRSYPIICKHALAQILTGETILCLYQTGRNI